MLTNTEILMFIQGYQGGTIHQLSDSLAGQYKRELDQYEKLNSGGISCTWWLIGLDTELRKIDTFFGGLAGAFSTVILNADDETMRELARLAQNERRYRESLTKVKA